MSSQEPSLEAKRAFFAHFRKLPHSDDENDDGQDELKAKRQAEDDDDELEPREQRMRHRHRRFFRNASPLRLEPEKVRKDTVSDDEVVVVTSSARPTPATKKPAETSGKRSRNVVDELLDKAGEDAGEVIGETPIDATKRQRRAPGQPTKRLPPPKLTTASSSSIAGASTTRKRKKGSETTVRPEAEQVLRGLVFYYVPDDDVAPARRLRIQKAREYGATRTSDASLATHVIVDKGISYQDAVKAAAAAGRGVAVVVSENYPIECVQFRALLDWRQKRYRLAGQPEEDGEAGVEAGAGEEQAAAKMSTKEKLQLKQPQRNPKRWDYAPTSTPPNASEEVPGVDSEPVVLPTAGEAGKGRDGEAAQAESVERNATAPKTTTPASTAAKTTAPGDELTKMIDMMQEFKDLPLDNDEEEEEKTPTAGYDSGSGSGSDSDSRRPAAPIAKKAGAVPFADRFACARSGTLNAHAANPNARTVEVLQGMLSYYERTGDQWRVLAYRRAIGTLRRQPTRVATERAALRLPGVGPRLAAKIAEVATTDRLRQLENAGGDGQDEAVRLFMGVHGVGPALAARWAARGLRSLGELQQGVVVLTPGQRVGVERYKDLNTRIPRNEVEALAGVVREEAARLDPEVEVIVGGSYRRGAPCSGDVDIILSRPGTTRAELAPLLRGLIKRLQDSKFLVATLTAGEDSGVWQGCCVLPGGSGTWRRMDFLAVPEAQMGAALIYFTGDDIFNRSLRLLARKKGMRLNQRGLYRRVGEKTTEGDLVEAKCERRIFEILGVKWREPTERWC